MKIKRIATLRTFKEYEDRLVALAEKYVAKAHVPESAREVVDQIKTRCHNPFALSCVIINTEIRCKPGVSRYFTPRDSSPIQTPLSIHRKSALSVTSGGRSTL